MIASAYLKNFPFFKLRTGLNFQYLSYQKAQNIKCQKNSIVQGLFCRILNYLSDIIQIKQEAKRSLCSKLFFVQLILTFDCDKSFCWL